MYHWPKEYMSGTIGNRIMHTMWTISIFYVIQYYNLELRSKIISQHELYVPKSPYDLEFPGTVYTLECLT